MISYYLWCGVGAIEDLETTDIEEAVQELSQKVVGHWTLWQRDGLTAKLVAIYLPEQREIRTGRFGDGVFEEFVFGEADEQPEEMATWTIWYVSCEGNRRWFDKEVSASWEEWQVRESVQIGGCGDDVAEIISVERR